MDRIQAKQCPGQIDVVGLDGRTGQSEWPSKGCLREATMTTRIRLEIRPLELGRGGLVASSGVPCELPVTGANISMLVTVGFLLVAAGVACLLLVRRRGAFRAVGIVIALAVGTTVLTFSWAPQADADSCMPTSTPAVAAAIGTASPTTAVPAITGSTSPIVTSPAEVLPEAPVVVAFPVIGLLIMSGYIVMRRRPNAGADRRP
jgi:LPXTG-motif cell wall-anchored protein